MSSARGGALASAERYHGLDALRAFALLLGVVFHSALCYVMSPGPWAVGTATPSTILTWFVTYTHAFRMELFFLLAGFFGAVMVERRGAVAYAKDRARRILLVFLVAVVPMKLALTALWVEGGRLTGWLQVPGLDALPLWPATLRLLSYESFPDVNLTHLWFLYYLTIIIAVVLALRGAGVLRTGRLRRAVEFGLRFSITSRASPWLLAGITTPLIVAMRGPGVDTPDKSLVPTVPVLALYTAYFTLGWALCRQSGLLDPLVRCWKSSMAMGFGFSVATMLLVGAQLSHAPWIGGHEPAVRWSSSLCTSLTMAFSVSGWLGFFVRVFAAPSQRVRYVADSAYWIYLMHLPLVVMMQVALAPWGLPWWVELPFLNVVVLGVLLLTYHFLVRFTWIGAWLNGKKASRVGL